MFAHLLVAVAVVSAVNLSPAVGPPTWAVLVFFGFRYGDIPVAGLIIGGALAAAAGRFLLGDFAPVRSRDPRLRDHAAWVEPQPRDA